MGAILMIANARTTHTLMAVALSVLSGCTFLIESDKKDCTKDSQCTAPYVCGKKNVCEVQTGCTKKEDCRQSNAVCIEGACSVADCKTTSGDCESGELCNVTAGVCVSDAPCDKADNCKDYDGAAYCIEGQCQGPQCKTTADCNERADVESSPTVECKAGICEDPIWGCLGKNDIREEQISSKEASLKVKVLYAYAQDGAMETGVSNLTWRVCQFGDPACDDDSKLVTTDVTYGEDNYLTIKGLESGLNYRLQLRGVHPKKPDLDLLPTEYLMYRTVVGETVEPKPILMFEDGVRDTLSALTEVNIDKTLGFLLMRIYDCQDVEVAGVQVASGTTTTGCAGDCPTTIFYQNTSNLPDSGATETNSAGRAGIVNLKPDVFNRITLTRSADNKKITSFVVTPRSGWLTYVYFWPWDYGTAAD